MNLKSLRRYPTDLARAFSHAPLEVGYAAVVAAGFSWALELDVDAAFQAWSRLLLVMLFAGGVAWAASLLHGLGDWSAPRRWVVSAAGAATAGVYGFFVLDMELEAHVWRAATLVSALLLAVTVVPALGCTTREEALLRFRRLNGRVVLRVVGAGLYAAALFAGLALAIAAVDSLFELGLRDEIYAHVWGWIAFAVAPWIVVGGLPDLVAPVGRQSQTMAVLYRIAGWLVLPLLVLYYGILYAYSVRILVLGELPSNLVSPLVLAAAVLGIGALVLFDRGPGEGMGHKALRLIPILFMPLAALGLLAVVERVGQYGWTEFRYLRVAVLVGLVGLAVSATVQVLRRQRFSVHLLPPVLAVVLTLSVVGPWSAQAVARRSQHARLVDALSDAGLLAEEAVEVALPAERPRVSAEIFDRIGESGLYLVRHFGTSALVPPLPAERVAEGPTAEELANSRSARGVPTVLGLVRVEPEGERFSGRASLPGRSSVPVADRSLVRVEVMSGTAMRNGRGSLRGPTTLELDTEAGLLRAELAPLVGWLTEQPGRVTASIPADRAVLPLTDGEGRERGHLVVYDISARGRDRVGVTSLRGLALIEASGGDEETGG